MSRIKRVQNLILHISLIKTARMNIKYFGLKGVFRPVILASRNLKIRTLNGTVKAETLRIGAIKIGFGSVGVADSKYNRAIWQNEGGDIIFEGDAYIGPGCKILVGSKGKLTLGKNVKVNAKSDIVCEKEVSIGAGTLISWDVLIMDTDYHNITDNSNQLVINEPRKIEIKENTWIACRCTILKGSIIPEGSVMSAGSTVRGKLTQANAIYANHDPIRTNITWAE